MHQATLSPVPHDADAPSRPALLLICKNVSRAGWSQECKSIIRAQQQDQVALFFFAFVSSIGQSMEDADALACDGNHKLYAWQGFVK